MVKIVVAKDSNELFLVGRGITLTEVFELADGVVLQPSVPEFALQAVADGSEGFDDYSATILGIPVATFSILVTDVAGGENLADKGWNSLWDFHLLSLAAQSPVSSLFSFTPASKPSFSKICRGDVRPLPLDAAPLERDRLEWARAHKPVFDGLISDRQFSSAMRCYGNAHNLYDDDIKIMLLWSGIEGLVGIESELVRRIALHSALLIEGDLEEKLSWAAQVRKAYGDRSKAVHGTKLDRKALRSGYMEASRILAQLLARCVELGKVPTPTEIEQSAMAATIR